MTFRSILMVFFLSVFSAFANTEKKPISIWVMSNGANSNEAMRFLLEKFQQETQIPTSLKILAWDNAFDTLLVALKAGQGPDVFQLGTTWVPYFAKNKLLKSLNSNLSQVDSSRFISESWKSSTIEEDSIHYSLPWFLDIRILYGNKSILDSFGIQENQLKTFKGFYRVLNQIAERNRNDSINAPIAPFGLPAKNDWAAYQLLASWIWGEGGKFLEKTDSGWRSALLDSNSINGMLKYALLLQDSALVPYASLVNSTQNTERFINGEQVFLMGSPEIIRKMDISIEKGGIREKKIGRDGLNVFPIPAGTVGQFAFEGGSQLALSATAAKNARKLLMFMVRVDNVDYYTHRTGFLPVDKSALHIWSRDKRYARIIQNLKYARNFANISEFGAIEKILSNLCNNLDAIDSTGNKLKEPQLFLSFLILNSDKKINRILGAPATNISYKKLEKYIKHKIKIYGKQKVLLNKTSTKKSLFTDTYFADHPKARRWTQIIVGSFILLFVAFVVFLGKYLHLLENKNRSSKK